MRAASALAVLTATVLLGSFAACSATHDPAAGEIFLAIDTNLKFPDDLDGLGVSIKNERGVVSEDATFPLGPGGAAQFPATIAVIRGTSSPITIRVVGYKGATPITVRETITTIPAGRTALLHVDLSFLNEGMVQLPATGMMVSDVTVSCAAGSTPIGGSCQPFTLDSATLPAYDATALGSSTGSSALDVDACLIGGSTVTPDTTGCTIPTPTATANVGLMVPASAGAGWCSAASCVVPLLESGTDGSQGDGWSLQADGLVHLPPGVCSKGYAVFTAPVTAGCPSFSLQHPALQNYGGTARDAGAPVTDSAAPPADASPVDGSSTTGRIFAPRTGVTSFAVDDTSVYLLAAATGGATVERLPALFATAPAPGPMQTVVAGLLGDATSAVRFPQFAFPSGSDGGIGVVSVDLNDGGTRQFASGGSVNPAAVTLVPGSDGGTSLVYALKTFGAFSVDLGTAGAGPIAGDPNASLVGSGTLDDGGTLLVVGEPHNQGISGSTLGGPLMELASNYATDPTEIIATPDGEAFWKDGNGSLFLSSDGSALEVAIAAASLDAGQTIAASDGRLFWFDKANGELMMGVNDGTTLGATQAVTDSAGATISSVFHVLVRNGMIYWFDGAGVYRLPIPAVH